MILAYLNNISQSFDFCTVIIFIYFFAYLLFYIISTNIFTKFYINIINNSVLFY